MVKGIYVLLTMFLLIGCATVMNPYKMDNRMHKIELGMTKQKVISILGKDFESAKNGILVEWFKEKTPINNNTAN